MNLFRFAALSLAVLWVGGISCAEAAEVVHVDPTGAEKLIQKGQVVVLDVRTADEYRKGHIAGATRSGCYVARRSSRTPIIGQPESGLIPEHDGIEITIGNRRKRT